MIQITAQSKGTTGEVLIFGHITDKRWYEEDVSPSSFNAALKELGEIKELHLRINSYGGSCNAGQAIVTMLDRLRAKGVRVVAHIEGIAASMATVIPQGADSIVMAGNAMMMIHKPLACAYGNADDMERTKELLDKYEDNLVRLYMRRFNGDEEELRDMLKAETWLDADEALAFGLCDEVDEAVEIAACADSYRINGLVVPAADLAAAKSKIRIFQNKGGETDMQEEKTKANTAQEDALQVGEITGPVGPKGDVGDPGNSGQAPAMIPCAEIAAAAGCEASELDTAVLLEGLGELKGCGISVQNVGAGPKAYHAVEAATPELLGKAAAYDKIVADATEQALTLGVKAKGEAFNRERWAKAFAGFTLDEIKAQGDEWQAEASKVLHAGVQNSGPAVSAPAHVPNPDDYKL